MNDNLLKITKFNINKGDLVLCCASIKRTIKGKVYKVESVGAEGFTIVGEQRGNAICIEFTNKDFLKVMDATKDTQVPKTTFAQKVYLLFANNAVRYIASSLIGANLVYLTFIICGMIIDFLLWDTKFTTFGFNMLIKGWTTSLFRLTVLCWLTFGDCMYSSWSKDYRL